MFLLLLARHLGNLELQAATFSNLLKQRRLGNGHYNTRSHALEVDSTHAGQDRHSTNPI
jgi:hypothetical protein